VRAFAADGHHHKEDKDAGKDPAQEISLKVWRAKKGRQEIRRHSDRTQEEQFEGDERRDQDPEEDGRQGDGGRRRGRSQGHHTATRGSRGDERASGGDQARVWQQEREVG
jgi:hypothetical protein